jgi:hypothetical protein
MTYFIRTEDGVAKNVTKEEGLAEANRCMMDGKREVAEMTAVSDFYYIWYKDGRKVTLSCQRGEEMPAPKAERPAEADSKGRRIVAVKGKRYVVGAIVPARPKTEGVATWVPEAFVSYWSERNGRAFGATRFAAASGKPGTTGRAIWDAVNR